MTTVVLEENVSHLIVDDGDLSGALVGPHPCQES